MYNEWELLVLAEDIEPGDTLVVERDSGEMDLMIYVREKTNKAVLLKDREGKETPFSTQTLEENGGYRYIVGKSDTDLKI